MSKKIKINLPSIVVTVITSLFVVGVLVVYANWTAPLSTPPTCNSGDPGCDAPVNVGPGTQLKLGALGVSGVLQAYGGIAFEAADITRKTKAATWVCQVGSSTCLGKYLWTINPGTAAAQYCYYTGPNTGVPATCVNVFSSSPQNYCIAPNTLVNRSLAGRSWWTQTGCTGGEYIYGGFAPYGTGQACIDQGGPVGVNVSLYRSSSGCTNTTLTPSGRRIGGVLTQNVFSSAYELR